MQLNMNKVEKRGAEWAEYEKLASFFSDAGSRVYIPPRDQAQAYVRYTHLHAYFSTR
jgi:hypothetical protein